MSFPISHLKFQHNLRKVGVSCFSRICDKKEQKLNRVVIKSILALFFFIGGELRES